MEVRVRTPSPYLRKLVQLSGLVLPTTPTTRGHVGFSDPLFSRRNGWRQKRGFDSLAESAVRGADRTELAVFSFLARSELPL